jgi:hypothetical protein
VVKRTEQFSVVLARLAHAGGPKDSFFSSFSFLLLEDGSRIELSKRNFIMYMMYKVQKYDFAL